MRDNDLHFLNAETGAIATAGDENRRIAFRRRSEKSESAGRPGLVWLGGFRSDMNSTKALALDRWAEQEGRAFLRFNYSGHGESGGAFADGTIGAWSADALAAIRWLTAGPQIVVGSSMGGWIALLVARALQDLGSVDRLAGMVLIAPAVDFTEALMWRRFSPKIRKTIEREGVWMRQSDYADGPYPITRALIEDGRKHLLLDTTIRTHCPVHILQGMRDPDVPWQHAMLVVEHLGSDPVSVTLIRDGDHRLSRDEDLARLVFAVAQIA